MSIVNISIPSYIFCYVADAGEDTTIALPETGTVLDGHKSKDDIKIVSYHWEQVR